MCWHKAGRPSWLQPWSMLHFWKDHDISLWSNTAETWEWGSSAGEVLGLLHISSDIDRWLEFMRLFLLRYRSNSSYKPFTFSFQACSSLYLTFENKSAVETTLQEMSADIYCKYSRCSVCIREARLQMVTEKVFSSPTARKPWGCVSICTYLDWVLMHCGEIYLLHVCGFIHETLNPALLVQPVCMFLCVFPFNTTLHILSKKPPTWKQEHNNYYSSHQRTNLLSGQCNTPAANL